MKTLKNKDLKALLVLAILLQAPFLNLMAAITGPQQVVQQLFSLMESKKNKLYDDEKCMEVDGTEILSMNDGCINQYLQYLEGLNLFSKNFLLKRKKEYAEMRRRLDNKTGTAEIPDYDRFYPSQDPPPLQQAIILLKKAVPVVNGNKALIIITFKKPYLANMHYLLVNEKNYWKIDSIY
jgi:hypothetical protein